MRIQLGLIACALVVLSFCAGCRKDEASAEDTDSVEMTVPGRELTSEEMAKKQAEVVARFKARRQKAQQARSERGTGMPHVGMRKELDDLRKEVETLKAEIARLKAKTNSIGQASGKKEDR